MFLQYFVGKEEKHILGFDKKMGKSHMTIGIVGCCPGCGVTHFAIALSGFCTSKLRKKTALLEMHGRNELEAATSLCRGTDCYPHFDSGKLPPLLNRGYEYLILDFGNIQEAEQMEFLRCDKKLVFGSLAPWKIGSFERFFATAYKEDTIGQVFSFFVYSGNCRTIFEFSRKHHIFMQNIPFIKNPFRIEKEHFSFFQKVVS